MAKRLRDYDEVATARSFGMTATEVRRYANGGLLSPRRYDGTCYYSEADRLRLAVIQKAVRLGFSDAEIRSLLLNRGNATPKHSGRTERLKQVAGLTAQAREEVARSRTLIAMAKEGIAHTAFGRSRMCAEIELQRQRLHNAL